MPNSEDREERGWWWGETKSVRRIHILSDQNRNSIKGFVEITIKLNR